MLPVLIQSVLPVVLLAGLGYLFGHLVTGQIPVLNRIALYVLMPVLVFHSLATTELRSSVLGQLVLAVMLFSLVMVLVAELAGRLAGQQPPILNSTVLSSVFSNSGNYGIPLSQFAFGVVGRTSAVVYMTAQALVLFTLGVVVAARGSNRPIAGTITEVFRLPLIHAAVLGYTVQLIGWTPPPGNPGWVVLGWLGQAAIPLVLIILGMELSTSSFASLDQTILPGVLKLLVAPVVALGVVLTVNLQTQGVAEVFLLECALPSAVAPLLLTLEYTNEGAQPDAAEYYSRIVLTTTLLSILIVPVLIPLLKSDVLSFLILT